MFLAYCITINRQVFFHWYDMFIVIVIVIVIVIIIIIIIIIIIAVLFVSIC